MRIKVGTFNLNNLFSRFNFSAEVSNEDDVEVESRTTFSFDDPAELKLRSYQGRLVKGKTKVARARIAGRIAEMDLDVLAVQEVEDVDTLAHSARQELEGLGYRHVVLVEGNDPRLIDVGLISRLPLGGVTSWRHAVHPEAPEHPVFSRDLLKVEVLNERRTKRLFTLYNTHLKSHFVPFGQDPVAGAAAAGERRRQQAEELARIVSARMRPNSTFVVVGDMNDAPDADPLAPLFSMLPLTVGLEDAVEDRPAPEDDPAPPDRPWTHRFKPARKPAHYQLFDHVWLSDSAAQRKVAAGINRRTRLGGDGSDHDPAWVELGL
jgi:endonuclease/exonuclease/phosphatase family metal-dependent hydrolase